MSFDQKSGDCGSMQLGFVDSSQVSLSGVAWVWPRYQGATRKDRSLSCVWVFVIWLLCSRQRSCSGSRWRNAERISVHGGFPLLRPSFLCCFSSNEYPTSPKLSSRKISNLNSGSSLTVNRVQSQVSWPVWSRTALCYTDVFWNWKPSEIRGHLIGLVYLNFCWALRKTFLPNKCGARVSSGGDQEHVYLPKFGGEKFSLIVQALLG